DTRRRSSAFPSSSGPSTVKNGPHDEKGPHVATDLSVTDQSGRRHTRGVAAGGGTRRVHAGPAAPGDPVRDGLAELPPALVRDRRRPVRRAGPGRRARPARRAGGTAGRGGRQG